MTNLNAIRQLWKAEIDKSDLTPVQKKLFMCKGERLIKDFQDSEKDCRAYKVQD